MSSQMIKLLAVLLSFTPALTTPVFAQDALKTFNDLFGQSYQTALKTRSIDDDNELAKKLIQLAPMSIAQPELAQLFCEKAFNLTSKSIETYPTAINAMQTLINIDESKSEYANAKILQLRQQHFIAAKDDDKIKLGNELVTAYINQANLLYQHSQQIQAIKTYQKALGVANSINDTRKPAITQSILTLNTQLRIDNQLKIIKDQIKQNPNNQQAKTRLFHLYLVDMDSPENARKFSFLFNEIDNALTYLQLLAKSPDQLTPTQSNQLATWYDEILSPHANTDHEKAAMYFRAKTYYTHFLKKHLIQDVKRIKAAIALENVNKKITPLQHLLNPITTLPKPTTPQTIDLLKEIDTDKHVVSGKWYLANNVLSSDVSTRHNVLSPASKPPASYELNITYILIDGKDSLLINLPIANQAITLVQTTKYGTGLSSINDVRFNRNATFNKQINIETDEIYKTKIQVTIKGEIATIRVVRNNITTINYTGEYKNFSPGKFASRAPADSIGLTTYKTQYDITHFSLKLIND